MRICQLTKLILTNLTSLKINSISSFKKNSCRNKGTLTHRLSILTMIYRAERSQDLSRIQRSAHTGRSILTAIRKIWSQLVVSYTNMFEKHLTINLPLNPNLDLDYTLVAMSVLPSDPQQVLFPDTILVQPLDQVLVLYLNPLAKGLTLQIDR